MNNPESHSLDERPGDPKGRPAPLEEDQRRRGRLRAALSFLFFPSWAQRKLLVRVYLWIFVSGIAAAYAYAQAWGRLAPPAWRTLRQPMLSLMLADWFAGAFWCAADHLGVLLGLISFAALLFRRRRLAGVAAVVAGLLLIPRVKEGWNGRSVPAEGPRLVVASFNLGHNNGEHEAVRAALMNLRADVLLLQEYTPSWHHALFDALAPTYHYYSGEPRTNEFGAAIYSAIPFLEPPTSRLSVGSNMNVQMKAILDLWGRDVALYNLHLYPPLGLSGIYVSRYELADVMSLLEEEPLPFILGGDLNFVDRGPAHWQLKERGCISAYDAFHVGQGGSWGSPWPPFAQILGLRVDHIYASPSFTLLDAGYGAGPGSSHRPVRAELQLRPAPEP